MALIWHTYHSRAECYDCKWESDDQMKAVIRGERHHRKTGHQVVFDRGITALTPKLPPPEKE